MAIEADVADLQAQVVALRLAVEGAWLSLLSTARDPAGDARRLGEENAAAVRGLDASSPAAAAMRDAVLGHTERLWGSIAWQLGEAKGERVSSA